MDTEQIKKWQAKLDKCPKVWAVYDINGDIESLYDTEEAARHHSNWRSKNSYHTSVGPILVQNLELAQERFQ